MVHITLLIAFAISTLKIRGRKNTNPALFISFFVLFLFAALRYEYGNDYEPYRKIFEDAQIGINSATIEPLYFELNKIFPSFQLLIATLSLFYIFAVYKLINKYVDKQFTGMAVFIFVINPYLFLLSLSSIRQTLVVTLFILSLAINPEKKFSKFAIFFGFTVISCLIHQTAILLFPFYYLYHGKRNEKRDYLFFGITPVVLLVFSGLLPKLIDMVLQLFSNNLDYLMYIESNIPNSLRSTLLFVIFYIYVLINLKKLDERTYPIAKLYLCGLLFAILTYRYSMFGRFQMYFDIFGVVTIPAIIKANLSARCTSTNRIIHVYAFPCAIFAIFVLRYYSFFTTELWSYFQEYHTILFK